MIDKLPSIIYEKEFKQQMLRFIPIDMQERTVLKEKFCMFLQNEISIMLITTKEASVSAK
jgi:hypothetical protein